MEFSRPPPFRASPDNTSSHTPTPGRRRNRAPSPDTRHLDEPVGWEHGISQTSHDGWRVARLGMVGRAGRSAGGQAGRSTDRQVDGSAGRRVAVLRAGRVGKPDGSAGGTSADRSGWEVGTPRGSERRTPTAPHLGGSAPRRRPVAPPVGPFKPSRPTPPASVDGPIRSSAPPRCRPRSPHNRPGLASSRPSRPPPDPSRSFPVGSTTPQGSGSLNRSGVWTSSRGNHGIHPTPSSTGRRSGGRYLAGQLLRKRLWRVDKLSTVGMWTSAFPILLH